LTQPAGTLKVEPDTKPRVVTLPAGRIPAPSLCAVNHRGKTAPADGAVVGEAGAVGDGEGAGEEPPTPESDGCLKIAMPATAIATTAATASNGLRYEVMWESLPRTRHACCWG
jgi:hypothetical protein